MGACWAFEGAAWTWVAWGWATEAAPRPAPAPAPAPALLLDEDDDAAAAISFDERLVVLLPPLFDEEDGPAWLWWSCFGDP